MEKIYFKAPIAMFSDFFTDTKEKLDDILYYAVYSHAQDLEEGTIQKRFKAAAKWYGITIGSPKYGLGRGEELFGLFGDEKVKASISKDIWFDFYKNPKTEFQKATFLAFVAIRSILYTKPYCKLENKFWLARMDGKSKSCEFTELSPSIRKYANEYQTKKLKNALVDGWGLKTYSRYTRGFYVSFTLTLEELIYEAEKRRLKVKEKERKATVNAAYLKAMERINSETETPVVKLVRGF